ncbi:MAG: hypothetical protein J6Y21_03370 [Clostridia bacterium]|nr:hypothetical protein [Clostridia bacterium]
MTFYDEHKTPVSSECDCYVVFIEDEDDYMDALEKILGESGDFEVNYRGPGMYMPEDVEIGYGEVLFTLKLISDMVNERFRSIAEMENEIVMLSEEIDMLWEYVELESNVE